MVRVLSGSVWNPGSDDTHIMSWLMKKKPRRPAPFVFAPFVLSFVSGRAATQADVAARARQRPKEAAQARPVSLTTSPAVLLNFAGFENMTGRF